MSTVSSTWAIFPSSGEQKTLCTMDRGTNGDFTLLNIEREQCHVYRATGDHYHMAWKRNIAVPLEERAVTRIQDC